MSKRSASSSSRHGKEPKVESEEPGWWETCDPLEFRRQFRMHRSTFNVICNELQPYSVTKSRKVSTPDFRRNVAAVIWKLASGQSAEAMEENFGLTYRQCRLSLNKFVDSTMETYVKWPDEIEMVEIKTEFERLSGIENVVGSLNTTRVQILKPDKGTSNVKAFYDDLLTKRSSGNKSFSTALQGLVDHNGIFRNIYVGLPGSLSDYDVYISSPLLETVYDGWIVGNRKFPLMEKILVPYTHYGNLTPAEQTFDFQLYEIESIAIDACLRLKSRWLVFQKELHLESVSETVKACCVLHNICEINGDHMDSGWRLDLIDNSIIPQQTVMSASASRERDLLAENLARLQLRL